MSLGAVEQEMSIKKAGVVWESDMSRILCKSNSMAGLYWWQLGEAEVQGSPVVLVTSAVNSVSVGLPHEDLVTNRQETDLLLFSCF